MSTPVRVASRYAAVVVVALTLAAVHVRRPSTVCLFRATTGLPCPFCGGTTAAVHLGHGDVRAAVAASPLAVLGLAAWPVFDAIRVPAWWQRRVPRYTAIAAVLLAAELWELHRFGVF